MKTVILASGHGSRFGYTTERLPKCLIAINGQTILERILTSLMNKNMDEVIITTGHLDHMIKDYIRNHNTFKQLSVTYVYNPRFLETNYIYSLWLAKKEIYNHDILLLHGDLVFDELLLNRLLSKKQSAVVVNKSAPVPQKDFKARIKNRKVIEIGVNVFGDNAFLCMPMYLLAKKDFNRWMNKIDQYVNANNLTCYAEDAFNDVSSQLNLYPLYFDHELCMEIDNEEDLSKAKTLLSGNK